MEVAPAAWLETKLGVRFPISGTCSIGRAQSNAFVIPSKRVSRRHALLHQHGDGEYLLVDLGSSNGTILNGRRIDHMTVLHDGDMIEIGSARLLFRSSSAGESVLEIPTEDSSTSAVPCWLLVAGTENAQAAKHEEPADESFKTVASWSLQCEQVIRRCGGEVARQSTEEIFAYWRNDNGNGGTTRKIVDALKQLRALQEKERHRFRVSLHFAKVVIEPARGNGCESLEGSGVTFAFHLHRLIWRFDAPCLMSKAAADALGALHPARPLDLGENISETNHPLFTC